MQYEEFGYVETALGDIRNRGKAVLIADLNGDVPTKESYVSLFRFGRSAYDYIVTKGTVSGMPIPEVYADYLWFDIDSADLDQAKRSTRQLVKQIVDINVGLWKHIVCYFSGQ